MAGEAETGNAGEQPVRGIAGPELIKTMGQGVHLSGVLEPGSGPTASVQRELAILTADKVVGQRGIGAREAVPRPRMLKKRHIG